MREATYARLTRFALWSLTVIVVSGSAVRLTGSGLGCEDWPTCETGSLIAPLEFHAQVEFLNRLFTGVVAAAVIGAVLGSLRRKPREMALLWWSLGLVAGVVAQVLLGALLVWTHLDPRFVMGHFLLSMVLLWNAVVLDIKARRDVLSVGGAADVVVEGGAADVVVEDGAADVVVNSGAINTATRWMIRAVFVVAMGVIVTGTLVTVSGPHAGDDIAERLPLLVREVTRIHSIVAIGLLALVAATWIRVRRRLSERGDTMRFGLDMLKAGGIEGRLAGVAVLLIAQGTLGYTQYFTGVPVVLVGIHVLLASILWIQIVRLSCAPVEVSLPNNSN